MAYNTWECSWSVSEPALKIGKRFKLLLHEYCHMMFELEQELQEEIKMEKKRKRTAWVRLYYARREGVEHRSTLSATRKSIFRCETSCEE